LDPEKWEDRNDSSYIRKYKEIKKLDSVLALCFADTTENYSLWKSYADNPSGVCIQFNRYPFETSLYDLPCIVSDYVDYLKLDDEKLVYLPIERYPFTKRYAFITEKEFRIIYTGGLGKGPRNIPITIDCIQMIILSPWLHPSVYSSVVKIIKKIKDCKNLPIRRSTILDNKKWKRLAKIID
jgi:hypothetical protein